MDVNIMDLFPNLPWEGPPLPRLFNIFWPSAPAEPITFYMTVSNVPVELGAVVDWYLSWNGVDFGKETQQAGGAPIKVTDVQPKGRLRIFLELWEVGSKTYIAPVATLKTALYTFDVANQVIKEVRP